MTWMYALARPALPLGLLLAAALTACHDEGAQPTAPCSGPSASPAGRVLVRYQEQLGSPAPKSGLLCQTEKIYPCGNYQLPQEVTLAAGGVSILFGEPQDPGLCLTTLRPAFGRADLSSLAAGTYPVTWRAAGRYTDGTLVVAADRVTLSSCDSNTVAVRYPVTLRIPPTTLWGQSYARTPAAQAAVAVVLDSLRRAGAVPVQLPPGHYSYFNVDAGGQLVPIPASQNGQPPSAVVTPLLLSYSGNFARIKAIVRSRPQSADLSFGLQSAQGESAW